MKIFSMCVVDIGQKPGKIITGQFELGDFSFFQRGSIEEFMRFFSRTVAEKTPQAGER